eukprot:3786631-Amphidinium_carterae.1
MMLQISQSLRARGMALGVVDVMDVSSSSVLLLHLDFLFRHHAAISEAEADAEDDAAAALADTTGAPKIDGRHELQLRSSHRVPMLDDPHIMNRTSKRTASSSGVGKLTTATPDADGTKDAAPQRPERLHVPFH